MLVLVLSGVSPAIAGGGQEVCPSGDGWIKTDGVPDRTYSVVVAAPEGKLIIESCVKAANEIDYQTYNPSVTSVTLVTPAYNDKGKPQSISHYAIKAILPPYDECEQLPGNQPEGTLCEHAPDTSLVDDERWSCDSGYETRSGTQTVNYAFDPESNSWIAQSPLTEWGRWAFQRELTPAEKAELDCSKPEKPEPIKTPVFDERWSCEVGYETRGGYEVINWVWDATEWTWTKAEPVTEWGDWTFQRALTEAELEKLNCEEEPEPVLVSPQAPACVAGEVTLPANTDGITYSQDANTIIAQPNQDYAIDVEALNGYLYDEAGKYAYLELTGDECKEVEPTPTPTPTPEPSVTPTPSPEPTVTPSTNPTPPTPSASPTKATVPVLASTGSNGVVAFIVTAVLLVGCGVALVILARRRKATHRD